MGNCYYGLGYKAYALQCYDRYIQLNPADTQARIVADSLRQQAAVPVAAPPTNPTTPTVQAEPTAKITKSVSRPKVGVELNIGSNAYGFSDYNVANPPSNYIAIHAGEYVKKGVGYGGSIVFRPDPIFQIGLDMEYLSLKHNGTGYIQEGINKLNGAMDYTLPAVWIGPSAYFVISPVERLKIRLGGGAGYFTMTSGDLTFTPEGASKVENLALSGSTFGFKVGGGVDFFFTPHYSLGVDVAYRVAKVTTVHGNPTDAKLGDFDPLEKPDGSNWPFDYSGMIFKAKVGFWF
jgi:opacity protein-like surface antigen